jgi:hypothetical protein
MQYYNHLFFNIALGIAYEVRAYALLFQVGIREIKNSILLNQIYLYLNKF